MGHSRHLQQLAASLNLLLISFSLLQYLLVNLIQPTQSFILPAVDNSSTLLNLTKINEKQLSFSELYPNLASLHQLLTSSIEYSSGQQYVQTNSPATTESETESGGSSSTSAFDQISGDQQTTDDLLSKDKSIINIKFIKKLPRKLDIKKQRKKVDYLKDVNLNFDSAYLVEQWNNCTVKFKSYVKSKDTGEMLIHTNYELQKQNYSKQIHVQIEGFNCVQLPIKQLKPYANNLTSLVVTRTGLERLEKYVFGIGGLMKLEQLYLHENDKLVHLKSRTFDGLSFLSYLSIINNEKLNRLDIDAFAGIKNLEELIYIGNGLSSWSYDNFSYMVKVISSRILPNLVHFHLSKTKCELVDEDEHEFEKMKKFYNDFFIETNTKERSKSKNLVKKPNLGIKINRHDLTYIDQVKYLQLEDCELVYIHPDAFKPLLKNLAQLNLSYNPLINLTNLKQILKQFFATNPNLSALKFTKKPLSSNSKPSKDNLDNDTDRPEITSSNSNNLLYLNSSVSPLYSSSQQYNQQRFNTFVNPINTSSPFGLETLDLSGVLTTLHLPKELFTVISKTTIKQLYLKNLFWKELQVGDLPPLPNLQTLHIDYSFLETIDENVFNTCENLVHLSLKGNLLSTIPLNMLEPLTKLERIDLGGYKSVEGDQLFYRKFTFCKKTFVYGTNLKYLNLNFKNLEILERKIFIGLFKLENLCLKHTNLKYVEYLTFFSLKSIVKIDLSNNPLLVYNIRQSEEDTFVGLEAIEEVNLSGCNITDQDINDQNLFKRMKENMRTLDLSNNLISKVDDQIFLDFNELRSINLSHNQINSWPTKIFTKQNFISSLDVSFNRLKEITPEMLADFRRLKHLGFSNNPLVCDCKWKGSILWLNNDNKQKKILNKLNNHEIKEHLESLVNRQQQIVTTVYGSTDLSPPRSILDWLEYSNAEFLDEQHPLRSQSYYCHIKESYSSDLNETLEDNFNSSISLGTFINHHCLNSLFINGNIKFTMLIVIVSSLMLLTTFCLMIALVYNSTLRNLIAMVDEDFLHHYEYDAFVSYCHTDKDWVINNLVPCLEELPDSSGPNDQQNTSKIQFSSIYPDNEQFSLKTWNKIHKSDLKNQKSNANSINGLNNSQDNFNQQNPMKLCVYDRDFEAGKQLADAITEGIRNSRKIILVVSKEFALSPWCRFETDIAHHTSVDRNGEGLILIKLDEDLSSEFLEKTVPQLHFLLKTRIYLQWTNNKKEQQVFWKKLRAALGFNNTHNGTYNHIRNMYQNYCTNHKPDLNRRHSVVLASTQNEISQDLNNNVLDVLNKNWNQLDVPEVLVKKEEQNAYDVEKMCIQTSADSKDELNNFLRNNLYDNLKDDDFKHSEDQIDSNNQLNEIKNDKLCRNINQLNSKLNEDDDRIELRNLNQFINSYDNYNLPFYRLMFTTQNLLPDLYDKFVFFKRLVVNLVFSGFSFRS